MTDRDVYRLLYLRLWRHAEFRRLTDSEKLLAIYMLSGPQTNRIGCYYFSPALAAEDLGVSIKALSVRLRAVSQVFAWEWREASRLFYVPSWLTWNRPNGVNATKAWQAEASRVADPMLKRRLLDAIGMASAGHLDGVVTQDQDQEQEQEQEVPPNPPVPGGLRITKRERAKAEEHRRKTAGRCSHDPTCESFAACVELTALELRGRRVPA